ncbi:hypothetical protein CDAR_484121 [Caerostris darwini]|uniref:Uncharacterized protein n=1 Tax=Caerostris darwini TaxID=1538125 RepID=A0AAV4T6T5_9ARAC|nr:hypothetical protein CDAR_484121 [Caerostris darwini]
MKNENRITFEMNTMLGIRKSRLISSNGRMRFLFKHFIFGRTGKLKSFLLKCLPTICHNINLRTTLGGKLPESWALIEFRIDWETLDGAGSLPKMT